MTAFDWDDVVQIETEPPRWLEFGEIKALLPTDALERFADEHLERAWADGGLVCPGCGSGTHANGTHGLDVYTVDKWHCIPCGRGGDIFDLAGLVFGTEDKLEQKRIVCEWAGIDPHGRQGGPEGSGDGTAKSGTAKTKPAADLTGEQQTELERYREQERQNIHAAQLAIEPGTPGYEYAVKRGFTSEEIAGRGLGYDPRKRRLVIPWSTDPGEFRHTDRDVTGTVEKRYKFLWCGGRVPDERIIPKQLRSSRKLNGKPALFNPSALEHQLVWAVEGLMDAMSIEAVGGHAIAFDGTAHCEGVKAIASKKYTGTIICALDNDQTENGKDVKGREANADLVKMLTKAGVKAVADRDLMPDGLPGGAKDANEVLQADRGTLQAYVAEAEAAIQAKAAELDTKASSGVGVIEAHAEIINTEVKRLGKLDKLAHAITNDPGLEAIAYNEGAGAIYVRGALPWRDAPRGGARMWDDMDDSHLIAYLQTEHGLDAADKTIYHALDLAAYVNAYDPIVDALESLPPWDGVQRAGFLLNWFLGVDYNAYVYQAERLMFEAVVRRAYEPGAKYDYMVVLVGPQGIGKSTFLRKLALRDEFFTDDIGKVDDEKFGMKIRGKTVVEMSELSAFKHSDIEGIKSAITRSVDQFRVPYGRHYKPYPRRGILTGSTNQDQFLTDETGNRRFLPVHCGAIEPKLDLFAGDSSSCFEQAYAEVLVEYKAGTAPEALVLPEDATAIAQEEQEAAQVRDPRIDDIGHWLEGAPDVICTAQICNEALGIERPGRYEARDVQAIVKRHFGAEWSWSGTKKHKFAQYGARQYFERRKPSEAD